MQARRARWIPLPRVSHARRMRNNKSTRERKVLNTPSPPRPPSRFIHFLQLGLLFRDATRAGFFVSYWRNQFQYQRRAFLACVIKIAVLECPLAEAGRFNSFFLSFHATRSISSRLFPFVKITTRDVTRNTLLIVIVMINFSCVFRLSFDKLKRSVHFPLNWNVKRVLFYFAWKSDLSCSLNGCRIVKRKRKKEIEFYVMNDSTTNFIFENYRFFFSISSRYIIVSRLLQWKNKTDE